MEWTKLMAISLKNPISGGLSLDAKDPKMKRKL